MCHVRVPFPMKLLIALPLAALACAPAAASSDPGDPADLGPDEQEDVATEPQAQGMAAYRDVEEVLTSEADFERWFTLERGLKQDFDHICADTFCGGDFPSIEALSFRCSVSTQTGQLKTCLWLFAGSSETVAASTGNIRPTARFFPCKIPVQGTPAALMDALLASDGDGPLWRPLPGSSESIYDVIAGCL
jgi:hypothetical protein